MQRDDRPRHRSVCSAAARSRRSGVAGVLRYRLSRHLLDLGGFLLTHHASLATATSHRLRTALTSPLTSRTTTTS